MSRLAGFLPGADRGDAMQTGAHAIIVAAAVVVALRAGCRLMRGTRLVWVSLACVCGIELEALEQETGALENFGRELFLEIHHLRLAQVRSLAHARALFARVSSLR